MAPTQDALYAEIDLDLSWSERDLPERERTKHVHRLHPYLGKFIPQLVEVLLARYVPRGGRVLDPFAGSGTTLVQGLESGHDAVGVDVAAFNCLLVDVKTRRYDLFSLESEIRDVVRQLDGLDRGRRAGGYLAEWFAPRAVSELLAFRELAEEYEHVDVLRVVLARAARSARLTTHFDLDFPRKPQTGEYWCHKHKRLCRPIDRADHFLRRYALDTLARIKEFSRVRARGREAAIIHGDSREVALPGPVRRRRHVAALPGPDRLPRAAPLRVRAARARRPPRARARRRRVGDELGRPRALRRGHRRGARPSEARTSRTRAGRDRRQRPSRSVPGDPRAGGAAARGASPPARQPPNRPPRRRVLRGHPRRSVATELGPPAPSEARGRNDGRHT